MVLKPIENKYFLGLIWLIVKARCWKLLNGVKLSFFYKDFTSTSQTNGLIFPDLHWAQSSNTKLGFWGKITIWRMDLGKPPKCAKTSDILGIDQIYSSTVWLNQNWSSSGNSAAVYLIKLTKSKLDRDLLKNFKKYYEWQIFPCENLKLWLTFERNEISHKKCRIV